MKDDRKVIDISEARPPEVQKDEPFITSVISATEDVLHTQGLADLIEMAAHKLEDGRAFLITIKGPDRVMDRQGKSGAARNVGYMAHMEVTLHERFE